MSLKITDAAVEQIKVSLETDKNEQLGLRIAAQRTPDGSIEYAIGVDEVKEIDTTSGQYGFTLITAPTSIDLLEKTVMDYVEIEPGKWNFIFLNPNDPNYIPPQKE